MSAILKLGTQLSKLGIHGDDIQNATRTPNLMGVRLGSGNLKLTSGKDAGKLINRKKIDLGDRVIIYPNANLNPRIYNVIVTYNPALLEYGDVSCPSFLAPGAGGEIKLAFTAARKTDLSKFDYIFELYMID